jgi:hypothetical protein
VHAVGASGGIGRFGERQPSEGDQGGERGVFIPDSPEVSISR